MTSVLQDILGIEVPIVQAPMAGVQVGAMAVAVSQAGGLGSLPCAMLSPEAMVRELSMIRARTTRPYNLNFFCHTQPQPDAARAAAWRAELAPYYREFDIDPATVPEAPGRAAFDAASAALLEEFRPPVVSFHFGLPPAELLAQVRGWGARILASATTLAEAYWLEARGVDVIIAQGVEAGGHRGIFLHTELSTQVGALALVAQIVRAVRVPVLAAGGIADHRGVRAALALGAAGAQIGTSYLLCPEAGTSAIHRTALQSDAASHTALTNLFTGRPARGIMNRFMREMGPINDRAPAFPLATGAVAPLRAKAEAAGSGDFTPLWSGQDASGCKAVGAGVLTRELAGVV